MTGAALTARPHRGPSLFGAQRWTATLAAASAFTGAALSGEVGLPLIALFVASALAPERWVGRVAHRFVWAWNAVLAGALLLFGSQVLSGATDIVVAAVRFVVLLLVHRLWSRKSPRDETMLLLLSLLLLCGGAALTADLTFAFCFAVYAVAGTWALALLHLRVEMQQAVHDDVARLHQRRLATARLFGALGALALVGLVGSMVVFVAFPRVTIGGFRRAASGRAVAGLSNRIELGGSGAVTDDPRVVLRVRIDGAAQRDLGYHFRAHALDQWTGRGWTQRPSPRQIGWRLPEPPWAPRNVETAEIEAVAGFTDGVVLSPPGWPLSVTFKAPLTARGNNAPRLWSTAAGDLGYAPADGSDVTYRIAVSKDAPSAGALVGRGREYPTSVQRSAVPPRDLDPRIRDLAQRLAAGLDPAEAAERIESWLRSSMQYTRELTQGGRDPVAEFLFVRRAGHCELFASAMVLMLRSIGIPARAVSGYYGGKRSPAGYHVVRAGDAHAWTEVYFPGAGYVPFDPTPSSDRGSRDDGLWARAVLAWDALAARWRNNVVEYDLLQQGRMLSTIASAFRDAARRFSGKGAARPGFKIPWREAGLIAGAAVALGILVAVMRRRKTARIVLRADERRAVRLWRRARSRLAHAGVDLPPAITAREAARRTASLGPQAHRAATAVIERYLESRWGGAPLAANEARALLRRLEAAL